jgi:hypothetical protein
MLSRVAQQTNFLSSLLRRSKFTDTTCVAMVEVGKRIKTEGTNPSLHKITNRSNNFVASCNLMDVKS